MMTKEQYEASQVEMFHDPWLNTLNDTVADLKAKEHTFEEILKIIKETYDAVDEDVFKRCYFKEATKNTKVNQ